MLQSGLMPALSEFLYTPRQADRSALGAASTDLCQVTRSESRELKTTAARIPIYWDVSSVRGASQPGAFVSALPKLPDCISCPWAATHFAAGSVAGIFEVANLSLQMYF